MVKSSGIGDWLRAIGRSLGIRPVEDVESSPGSGDTPASKPGCPHYRLEVDAAARRLVDNYKGSVPRMTAGEIARRAERQLRLIEGGKS